jgi:hypothetical protein
MTTLSCPSLVERPRAWQASRAISLRLARAPAACFHLARGARGTSRQNGKPRGPQARCSLHRRDGRDRTQSIGAPESRSDSTWPRSFCHDDIHTSTPTGVTAAVPPNLFAMKIPMHAPPTFMAQGCTDQGMAPARRASERRGQKINAPTWLHATGKLFPPDKEDGYAQGHLFCSSLSFSRFHPFTAKYNPSPPFRSYKRGGRGHV